MQLLFSPAQTRCSTVDQHSAGMSVYGPQQHWGSCHCLCVSSSELFVLRSPSCSAVAADLSPDSTSWVSSLCHAGFWQPVMKALEAFIWDVSPFPHLAFNIVLPYFSVSSWLWFTVAWPCVCPLLSQIFNCILTDGLVHLVKLFSIKDLSVLSASDAVFYLCKNMLHSWMPSLCAGEPSPAFNLSLIYCTKPFHRTHIHCGNY